MEEIGRILVTRDGSLVDLPQGLINGLQVELKDLNGSFKRIQEAQNGTQFQPVLKTQLVRIQSYIPALIVVDSLARPGGLFDEFKMLIGGLQEQVDRITADGSEIQQAGKAVLAIKEDSVNAYKELERLKTDTQKLAGIKSGKILNDDFASRADEQAKQAYNWTVATWVFAIVTVVLLATIAILSLLRLIDLQTTSWGTIATKILAIATLGFITKWCSKRANHHLREEAKYHRLAINIAAVNPFISAHIEKEAAEQVFKEVALKIFAEDGSHDSDTSFESSAMEVLGKTIADQLVKSKSV